MCVDRTVFLEIGDFPFISASYRSHVKNKWSGEVIYKGEALHGLRAST